MKTKSATNFLNFLKLERIGFFTSLGFTLIELLVVIAIIALLSTMAVVYFTDSKLKARDAIRMSDIRSIQSAIEVYKNTSDSESVPNPATWSDLATALASHFPGGLPTDPGNGVYVYCSGVKGAVSGMAGNYLIGANLEAKNALAGGLTGQATTATYGATVADACVASTGAVLGTPNCDPSTTASGDVSGSGLSLVSFCLGSL